jgi:hypothetical protein
MARAKRPGGTEYEDVMMLDNYYGSRYYGVRFPDGAIYEERECILKK